MKTIFKKTAVSLFALIISLGCFSGCNFGGEQSSSESSETQSSTGELVYESVLGAQTQKAIKAGETLAFDVDKDISGKEYVKINIKTDVNLEGEYVYTDVENSNKEVKEAFFIEKSNGKTTEFKQFFDCFRKNAIGNFDKVLKEIRFTNVSEGDGKVTLEDVSVTDREFPEHDLELYIEKGELKVGADLIMGGALSFLARTSYGDKTVDEVVKEDGDVYIGVDAKSLPNNKEYISSEVNLINMYDSGRQIQQSYYANVGGSKEEANGENGYTRAICTTEKAEGFYWPYNPVQAGDCALNPSQIIDYEVTDDEIYVKTRAMDWGKGDDGRGLEGTIKGGSTTKSYMENWYTIKSNMLFVENRFIDWNGFTDMHTVIDCTNELPATFPVHALHKFVTYEGMAAWGNDPNLYENAEVPSVSQGGLHKTGKEDWFAWVNEDNFGMGVYVANTQYYSCGHIAASRNISEDRNTGALVNLTLEHGLMYNKPMPKSDYTSCYVFNTSYTAPVVTWTMREYTPMTYKYAISVDYVNVMRAQFYDIHESGEMQNETLMAWK